jgi:HAD superfamily hydrolase (TIGR01490 family)
VKRTLVLFDLDNTLLTGDSDVLWCDFLMERGLLDAKEFAARNEDMDARYRAGTVSAQEFAGFYVSLLAGRSPQELEPLRRDFLAQWIVPRIPRDAMELVERHRQDLVVMTTATNHFITALTAAHFGIEHLIAIEAEIVAGRFSGKSSGILNMREGKVTRMHDWLRDRGERLADFHSTAYSDSINDLPLLEAVDDAVAVDADPKLQAIAQQRGWRTLHLAR